MAFRFRRREKVKSGIRRIAAEQLDKAIAELRDSNLDDKRKVHQARKRLKKLRGLVRLVRPGLGVQYNELNTWFRDRARGLSHFRDTETLVDTVDKLALETRDDAQRQALGVVRTRLAQRRDTLAKQQQGLASALKELRKELASARAAVKDWQLQDNGDKVLVGGLHRTYKRARKAMKTALAEPTDENWHEWRKRMKYHWYHMRLLENSWKPVLAARAEELSRLSELLGDDHDLAVLATFMKENRNLFEQLSDEELAQVTKLSGRRRRRLQTEAKSLGKRLFTEKPGALSKRMQGYWRIWRE